VSVFNLSLLAALTLTTASAQLLPIINANFANVPVECAVGWAAQSAGGGTCSSYVPQQSFNVTPGMGWKFNPVPEVAPPPGNGLTDPNTEFDPPPFTGLPFGRAAYLQGAPSGILQTVSGFQAGRFYALRFYLGSRYAQGGFDGNQTVQITIDGKLIATIGLVSYTPFTLHAVYFNVTSGGTHIVKFAGAASGDHTAFVSGVSIEPLF
jgi:hypothetical protein